MYNLAQLLKTQGDEMEQRARQAEKDAREMADPTQRAKAVIREDLARYPLRVGPSSIHRFGVFTPGRISAGRKIIPYTGELISRREAVRRSSVARTYLLRLNDYRCVDGSAGGSGAELI